MDGLQCPTAALHSSQMGGAKGGLVGGRMHAGGLPGTASRMGGAGGLAGSRCRVLPRAGEDRQGAGGKGTGVTCSLLFPPRVEEHMTHSRSLISAC